MTLPVKGPEKDTLTVAPAGTTRGTLNEIVAVMRPSGFPSVRDSIVAVPTVIRVSVDAWFVTVMRPTSLPVGPPGWTTFWTLARIVPMHTAQLRSFVDLDLRPSRRKHRTFTLRGSVSTYVVPGKETDLPFRPTLKMSAKPL